MVRGVRIGAHMGTAAVLLCCLCFPRRGPVRGADDGGADVETVASRLCCPLSRTDEPAPPLLMC